MVSTRGIKSRFSEGEKVLCYEPDPSKAKVLYDSKVLEVVPKGRKSVEYLIHFQGWNSSWDRFVQEDLILSDTEENRQLQRHLAEKAQLQLKDRGSRPSKQYSDSSRLSDSDSDSDMDESLSLDLLDDLDDDLLDGDICPIEEEEIVEELEENKENEHENEQYVREPEQRIVPLDLPKELKTFLDVDRTQVKFHRKRVRLPANPNIHTILDKFVKEFARELLTTIEESKPDSDQESMRSKQQNLRRPRKRQRRVSSNSSCDGEEADKEFQEIQKKMRLCTEVVHSLRYYIDFLLGSQLLYGEEMKQYKSVMTLVCAGNMSELKSKFNPPPFPVQQRLLARIDSDSDDQGKSDTEAELLEMISAVDENFAQRWNDLLRDAGCEMDPPEEAEVIPEVKVDDDLGLLSGTRSSLNPFFSNSPSCSRYLDGDYRFDREMPQNMSQSAYRRKVFLESFANYRVVPESELAKSITQMSQLYGAIHLSRLLVKLPQFLYATKFPDGHIKVIQRYLNQFIQFISKQSEWFGEQHYYSEAEDIDESDSSE